LPARTQHLLKPSKPDERQARPTNKINIALRAPACEQARGRCLAQSRAEVYQNGVLAQEYDEESNVRLHRMAIQQCIVQLASNNGWKTPAAEVKITTDHGFPEDIICE